MPAINPSSGVKFSRDATNTVTTGIIGPDGNALGVPLAAADITASFNVLAAHANMLLPTNSTAAVIATIQPDSALTLPVGFNVALTRRGLGSAAFAAGTGVTIRTPSTLAARAQYSTISAVKIGANEWLVGGDLA